MSIYPSLTYHDVEAAIEQLQAAFGFTLLVQERDGDQIRAASLHWGTER